ncbi:hypothetical protein [Mesorhizobium sp. INR15]|uniref:hypothetical protein n=1 Tax=Mesorhizobium sp. INR15 TaxID=2654248 RepID=UPI0018966637|nr:hypothetical protein [Mesorhizobium sp. INR15]QPC89724.1 hypothetical protein GA829_03475 [Mesorhizobium sp. INR15]
MKLSLTPTGETITGVRVSLHLSLQRPPQRALLPTHQGCYSVWRGAYGSIVKAIMRLPDGRWK